MRYLEARLLDLARAADNAAVDNGTAPVIVGLTEPEVADMEAYLANALTLFPLVGVNVFEPPEEPVPDQTTTTEGVADLNTDGTALFLRTPLVAAEGRDSARGFLVHEGALARREAKVMQPGYQRLRPRLIDEHVLVVVDDDQMRLAKSFLFESPSAAASVLSGGNKNGRTEWKDGSGRTLKKIQESTAS